MRLGARGAAAAAIPAYVVGSPELPDTPAKLNGYYERAEYFIVANGMIPLAHVAWVGLMGLLLFVAPPNAPIDVTAEVAQSPVVHAPAEITAETSAAEGTMPAIPVATPPPVPADETADAVSSMGDWVSIPPVEDWPSIPPTGNLPPSPSTERTEDGRFSS